MHKKGIIGDAVSGPAALIAFFLIMIIATIVFFGPYELLRPEKQIILDSTAYTDNIRLMNLLHTEYENQETFTDHITSFVKNEYEEEKFRQEIKEYLLTLPKPENSAWGLVIYNTNNQETFKTLPTEDKHLIQTSVIPTQDPENPLKVEIFLKTKEKNLEAYS